MTNRPWWVIALQWTAWFFVMMLVASWLAKARKRATPAGSSIVLVHPRTTLVIGATCTAFFALLVILSANSVDADEWWVPVAFMGFVLLGVATLAEALRVRHELTDTGIAYQGLLWRFDHVAWDEIVSARWSPTMKWLIVTTSDGRVMRFSALLNGLGSLAAVLVNRAPALDVDKDTAQMLIAAREGRLPNVF